jgi:hypothetical protein
MQIATRSGLRRAALRLACALAVTCSVPGCITYSVAVAKESTYHELAVGSALAALEIGGGILGGYAIYKEEMGKPDARSLGEDMLKITGSFLVVDAIIALIIWASDNSKH